MLPEEDDVMTELIDSTDDVAVLANKIISMLEPFLKRRTPAAANNACRKLIDLIVKVSMMTEKEIETLAQTLAAPDFDSTPNNVLATIKDIPTADRINRYSAQEPYTPLVNRASCFSRGSQYRRI
jgi:hypothetical protein